MNNMDTFWSLEVAETQLVSLSRPLHSALSYRDACCDFPAFVTSLKDALHLITPRLV